jgi:hypothetical protein
MMLLTKKKRWMQHAARRSSMSFHGKFIHSDKTAMVIDVSMCLYIYVTMYLCIYVTIYICVYVSYCT